MTDYTQQLRRLSRRPALPDGPAAGGAERRMDNELFLDWLGSAL
ncbi:hypothetical protein P4197_07120 [Pseudomonas aeruginosa]|nr:hypothetical protein [Pseudomonas aeruginosa]